MSGFIEYLYPKKDFQIYKRGQKIVSHGTNIDIAIDFLEKFGSFSRTNSLKHFSGEDEK